MKFLRFLLRLSVLLTAYSIWLAVIYCPWLGLVFGVCVIAGLARNRPDLYAHGTARWADASDLEGMTDG